VLRLHTNAQSRAQGAQRSGLAGREVAAVCAVLRRRRSPQSSAHSPASRGGNLPKYLYSSEAHVRRRRDYEKRRSLGCSQGSTHRQSRYQLWPSTAFAQVIECAGTCITRRPLLRSHHSRVISTRPSPHLLRSGALHYERKHSVLQLTHSEPG